MFKRNNILEKQIFSISSEHDFEQTALNVFNYQYENVSVYRDFCKHIGKTHPQHWTEIPFLPISLFKTHTILVEGAVPEKTFKSSGTTSNNRSKHSLAFLDVYEKSFFTTFTSFFGDIQNTVILGLLPNYIEQGDSSLVYMVEGLVKKSNNKLSGFFLHEYDALYQKVQEAKKLNLKVIILGVAYALMDLADNNMDLSETLIIETGGMKGRRKELLKDELHDYLKTGLSISQVHSEYGMTELLSQAYLMKDGYFKHPNWMRFLMRDTNDPFSFVKTGKTGGINVIDLANLYSCSFIATDDLGVAHAKGIKIVGRFDNSDIRGCNLMVS